MREDLSIYYILEKRKNPTNFTQCTLSFEVLCAGLNVANSWKDVIIIQRSDKFSLSAQEGQNSKMLFRHDGLEEIFDPL